MKVFKNIDEIRTERSVNRDNSVVYEILGVLLGELDRRPNLNTTVSEQDIYKTIKKLYEAAVECGKDIERNYLENFIKKQFTEQELTDKITDCIHNGYKTIGDIMKFLNLNYSGQFDGKMASNIIKKYV